MPTGQKLLDSLAETWDFFFSDVLPTLQAVFYPVQVSRPARGPLQAPGLGAGTPCALTALTAVRATQKLVPTHRMK